MQEGFALLLLEATLRGTMISHIQKHFGCLSILGIQERRLFKRLGHTDEARDAFSKHYSWLGTASRGSFNGWRRRGQLETLSVE